MNWTEEEYLEYMQRFVSKGRQAQTAVDSAVQATNPQRHAPLQRKAKNPSNQVDQKFRVCVHNRFRRARDAGGSDYKPAIDGITEAGIWMDDSLKYVEEIRETYKQGPIDETVIEVWEILKR